MRVRVLGGLGVDGVAERDLGSRKGRTLLKLLVLERGAPVTADRIADVLWGDTPPQRPTDQVGVLVSRLRAVVGADRLLRTDAGYAVLVDWLDVDELAVRSAEASAALADGRHAAARAAAEAALALARRGPVLPDEDGDWLVAERLAADRAVATAGVVAASAALAAGDHDGAVVAATAAMARDPYDEGALRALMAGHAAAGRPASALAAYATVRERLAEDLGVSPATATEALHDQILRADDVAPAATAPPPVVLGRATELASVRAATAAPAALVVVVGEAGIGKSTIARAVAAGFEGTVLWGRCDELGRDLPLQPIVDAVVAAGGDDVVAPVGTGDATVVRATDAGQAEVFAALLDAVGRTSIGTGRLLLVVEDLHLAAAGTLAWLAFARRRRDRLVVLATSRPPAPPIPGAVVVPVGPLDHDASVALVGGGDAAVLARGAGNPLLLLALAAAPSGPLPASVLDVLAAPVDALGPTAAGTVRTAACLGEEVDLDLVAEVLARPAIEVLGELEQAARAGVLDERGPGFAFRHTLVREALESAAGAARRAFVHREAARVLADRPGHDPLAVAVHARLGGATDLAVDAFVRAAAVAAARFDAGAAIEHLDAALALAPSAAAHAARARVRMSVLDHAGAAVDATAAVALGGGAEALETSAWVAYYQRRYDDAVAAADAALARAGDDAALRASCRAVAGRVLHARGDLAAAVERLADGDGSGVPPAVQGVVDVWLAHARLHQGRTAEGLAAVDRALLGGDSLAHPWAAIHGRFARVMALGQAGRLADAFVACDRMDADVAAAGAVGQRFAPAAANLRSWLWRAVGRVDDALACNDAALATAGDATGRRPAAGMAEAFWVAHLDAADAALTGGRVAVAAEWVDRAAPVDGWQGSMAWHQRHRLGLLRARLALLDADADGAAGLAAVVADAAARGADRYRWLATGWLAVATGQRLDDDCAAGLAACAALEAWPLLATLGRRADADAVAARVIADAGPWRDDVAAYVASTLTP